ncbi:preprotein translocase subunit YajC [Amycolatopsis roodepoortensis]|uniref:Preprotein translocase subunit YajC n=1 Tax=Amycolatopsis lurida NRRL 2430 TaxID=1460371 RepID=A0A2P2FYI3_AMYLU|nr:MULTISPECIES: preprotein translocase subunit YajC [Amycolatopsis]KFU81786.1 preprotein translocase subunit YajC [Amycolatopsis lurida NRRL 2430]RSN15209.1 preprotein translocase subunit YajC [Streptomyces sp. WAC 05977]UUV31618.1 preprotein translocase subunit YajC [Amycolatopsis roodepoortensis]SEB32854.1 preprotein translocase subunit YajC [Amycolatopsis lurida]
MNQLLLPLLLMLVVAIPLVMGTRKQKKAAAAQQELLASLAPGDRVMTTSGLYASVADASADTTIDLEIAPGVVTTWLRQAVREKVEPVVETDEDVTDATDTDEVVEAPVVESKDDERVEEKSGAQIAPPLEHGKK